MEVPGRKECFCPGISVPGVSVLTKACFVLDRAQKPGYTCM